MRHSAHSGHWQRMSDTMKVKCEGVAPSHCFFWIVTLSNNNVIPEYDFDLGKHNKLKEMPIDFITKMSWYPVTKTIMEKAWSYFGEILFQPNVNHVHSLNINLNEGEKLRIHPLWRNDITFIGKSKIETIYALFKTKKDGTIEGFWIDKDGNVIKE